MMYWNAFNDTWLYLSLNKRGFKDGVLSITVPTWLDAILQERLPEKKKNNKKKETEKNTSYCFREEILCLFNFVSIIIITNSFGELPNGRTPYLIVTDENDLFHLAKLHSSKYFARELLINQSIDIVNTLLLS